MATPTDISVGPFARECQSALLMGRVLRHAFEPTSDSIFHKQEFEQLEITLKAFQSVLREEQDTCANHCTALSLCSWYKFFQILDTGPSSNLNSALFTLYDSELLLNQHNEAATNSVLRCMEATATRLARFSILLFSPIENVNIDKLSPFVLCLLYQVAAVQLRMWRLQRDKLYGENLNSLKNILSRFNMRWRAAGNSTSLHSHRIL